MSRPSDFQFDFVMRTGWHPHPIVIDNRMRVSSGSHYENKLKTGWSASGSHARNRRISPFAVDNAPNLKL